MTTIQRLWPWTRNLFALIGGATLASLAWFWGALWYESRVAPPVVQSAPVSPVAEKVAGWIAPALTRFALGAEDDFARAAPSAISRWIFHRGYPYAVKAIPAGTRVGCNVALDRFGSMTAREMAELVVEHQRHRGRPAHPSVRALAGGAIPERTTVFP